MTVYSATGTLLKIGDGASPEVFTNIGQVRDISGPGFAMSVEEATHHGSSWKEYVPGMLEGGEVSFEILLDTDDATHYQASAASLYSDMINRRKRNFKMVLPDANTTTFAFAAYVTSFEVGAPVEGLLTASVTLQITGNVTVTVT